MPIKCDTATIGCDYIGATVQADTAALVDRLARHLETEPVTTTAPRGYGYPAAVTFPRGSDSLATVLHCANRMPFVIAQGYRALDVKACLTAAYAQGEVTVARRDTAVDLADPDWFEVVYLTAAKLARKLDLTTDMRGDWTTPGSPKGRTFYLGARSSLHYLRIYEFRKHHGYGADVRIELETKPSKRDHKEWLYIATDQEVIQSSRAMRELLETLGIDASAARPRLHHKPPSDLDRAVNALLSQYGKLLRDQLVPTLGGDLSEVGPELMRRLDALEAHRAAIRQAAASGGAASIHEPRSFLAGTPVGE